MLATRWEFIQSIPAANAFPVAGNLILEANPARAQEPAPLKGHFHPKGKAPSEFSLDALKQARGGLSNTSVFCIRSACVRQAR